MQRKVQGCQVANSYIVATAVLDISNIQGWLPLPRLLRLEYFPNSAAQWMCQKLQSKLRSLLLQHPKAIVGREDGRGGFQDVISAVEIATQQCPKAERNSMAT